MSLAAASDPIALAPNNHLSPLAFVHRHGLAAVLVATCAAAMATGNTGPLEPGKSNRVEPDMLQAAMVQLHEAAAILESGDAAGAVAMLDRLIAGEPTKTVAHAARMMRGQIRGVFAARQAFWHQRTVANVIVLVPDEATFLAAVAQWTPDRFWPILIEDGWLTPIFVRAFRPAEIWRVTRAAPGDGRQLKNDVLAFVKTLNRNLADQFEKRPRPPGIVLLDPSSAQRMGGIALACGRGQPTITAAAQAKRNAVVPFQPLLKLNAQLMKSSLQWRLNDSETWFAVTLAGPYPYRYEVPSPPRASPEVPNEDAIKVHLRAVDDLIGRIHADDTGTDLRVAVVGRVTGDPVRSIYQAMCSLFLQPQRMAWVDAYSHQRDEAWRQYDMSPALELMAARYVGTLLRGQDATVVSVRRRFRPAHDFGMIWINSKGGAKIWHLDAKAGTDDFPIGTATAMHVVHSYSLARPWNNDTLAGRALAGGAYWYYGSIAEPYLVAFNRPVGMAAKMLAGTPAAFAARQIAGGPRALPWRLMLIGDPLFTLRAEPARREAMASVPGAVKLQGAVAGGPLASRLRSAVLLSDDAAVALAQRCLEDAASLSPDELVLALGAVYLAGRPELAAAIPHRMARAHPMAAVLARLGRLLTNEFPVDTGER